MPGPNTFDVDIGDTHLQVHEWSGAGGPVLMLHATGFHSRCWDQVIARLDGLQVYAVDLPFHGGSGVRAEVAWKNMCEDVNTLLQQLALEKLIGVGHSIGGHILARLAAWAPQRFRHLVLIDPVIMSPRRFELTGQLRQDLQPVDHPVSRRRNRWRSAGEMYQRFADREPFNSWQPAVLRDYCDYALRHSGIDDVLELACDPLHEASIYLNSSADRGIYAELPGIQTPVTLLRAPPGAPNDPPDFSKSPTWEELAAVLPHCTEIYLPDMNHFIPMQDPALVAKYIQSAQ